MSSLGQEKYVDLVLTGKSPIGDIDAYVERWHRQKPAEPLHEYLGLTWEEYASWVEDPSQLAVIIAARKKESASPDRPPKRARRRTS